jgi:hypothetical protein
VASKVFKKRIAPEQIQFPEVNSADELSRNKINSQGSPAALLQFFKLRGGTKKSHLR